MAELKAEGRRPDKGSGGESGRRAGGGTLGALLRSLAVGLLAILAGLGGIALWLALASADTMEELRLEADRRSVAAELPLPPVPTGTLPEDVPAVEDAAEDGAIADDAAADDAADPAADDAIPEPPSPPGPADLPGPFAPPPADGSAPAAVPEPILPTTPEADPVTDPGPEDRPAVDEADPPILPEAPRPELTERSAFGPLPRIGPEGEQPWQVYARPVDADDPRPRLAIVVTGLGPSRAGTEEAIERLPPDISLAFSPYTTDLATWLGRARRAGHETLLMVPMEPERYPENDPGPHTLLAGLPFAELQQRLHWSLARGEGYVGVMNLMGSRFTANPDTLAPVLEDLAGRGLMFLDARTVTGTVGPALAREIGVPFAINDRTLDAEPNRREIDRRLQDLIQMAQTRGVAVGLAEALPLTLDRLTVWLPALEAEGIALVPITAVVGRQAGP